jgi:hypothetical protein
MSFLVQIALINGSNGIRKNDKATLTKALCLAGDKIMTMLSFLI